VSLAIVSGCSGSNPASEANEESAGQERKAIPVEVVSVTFQPVEHYLEAVGSLDPEEEVTVSAEVAGVVEELFVDEGSQVERGGMILRIDDETFRLEVEEVQANLSEVKERLKNAEDTFKRITRLYEQGVSDQQAYDDARTQRNLNRMIVNNLEGKLGRYKKSLKDTKVNSPLEGVVSERMISAGEYVKVATELVRIVDSNPLRLTFSLPEQFVAEVQLEQLVRVKVKAYPNREFEGKVYYVSPKVDSDTRMVEVKAWVDNDEGLLKPGFFVDARLMTGSSENAMVLPEAAVLVRQGRFVVMAVEEGAVRYKGVETGSRFNGKVQIVGGVAPEDKLILAGMAELVEGSRVKVVSAGSQS
jgi:membrane fusion protein (multidrug efflux system)